MTTLISKIAAEMSRPHKEKVCVYVDGFNMYHALSELKLPHLKWLNLKKLSYYLIKHNSQSIVGVKYFSAFAEHFNGTDKIDSLLRHRSYVRALEAKGVDCIMGNFAKRDRIYKGKGYKAQWRRYEEKQTDVGIGVHLINDAHLGRFDRAFVISLDTDLMPALKIMKKERPHQPVIVYAPPHRAHHRDIQAEASSVESIKVSQIERSLFGANVVKNGRVVARRPNAYKPPS